MRNIVAAAAAFFASAFVCTTASAESEQWVQVARAYQSVPKPDGVTKIRWGAGDTWVEATLPAKATVIDCRPNGSFYGIAMPTVPKDWQESCHAWMLPSEAAPSVTPAESPNAPPVPETNRMPIIDMTDAPAGNPGVGSRRIKSTSELPTAGGAFRVPCEFTKFAFIDPIVYPGIADKSHLHAFFGNAGVSKDSNYASLLTSGNSTCKGGTVDRTAYWVPAMVDTATGKPVVPGGAMFYYKTGYGNIDFSDIQVWPDGLRMIAGSITASEPGSGLDHIYRCSQRISSQAIPKCNAGEYLRMEVNFPECWDGKNLDSPDHKSHMAYRMAQDDRTCPASHPVPIPRITFHVDYWVTAADDTSKWRLSSDMYDSSITGGYSAHGDFDDGWDPVIKRQIVDECIRANKDCHAHLIGNGQAIY